LKSVRVATAAATVSAAAFVGQSLASGIGRSERGKFLRQLLRAAMRTFGIFPIRGADEDFAVAPALFAMEFVNRHGTKLAGFAFSFNGQHLSCGHGAFAKGD
jgi:hypothetical protein